MVRKPGRSPQSVQPLFASALSGKSVPTHPPTASRRAPPSLHERGILVAVRLGSKATIRASRPRPTPAAARSAPRRYARPRPWRTSA
ncbi:hypothetical protein CA606_20165 [Caulobacter vibrioides]|uniref:Uncharacterized protein n=1 Tax=Caulobacter vibrioides TaxID=155892 RepID=A0A2S1B7L7_CAUVI|nr:hypothetical protein CA606_20165 [Caulobacter vibrioides]